MGYTVGPATGGASAGFLGFESTFVLAGLLQLTAVLLALIFLPKAPTVTSAVLNSGRQGGVRRILRDRAILITLITVFILHTAMGSLGSFFPLYLSEIGFSPLWIGALFALQAFTYAMARFVVAGYSDRTGHRALPLSLGLIGVAITLAFVATFQSLFVIASIVALLGLSFGVANLLQGTIVAERTDHHTRGTAIGLFTSVLTAGIGVGPGALAFLVASQGFEWGFRADALFIFLGAIVFLTLRRMTKLR
jgi:predicted MFS family arabinose efflux permease